MAATEDLVTQRARARIGRVLKEKWRLDALLGVGGMAAVYAATHRNGKRVAIKLLHPELSIEGEIRTRFLREGYVANTVGHPGAVSVADDDVAEDGAVFLVMDLLEGETVDSVWERRGRRLSVDEAVGIADQLLDVLTAAHARGIVHRDIKPENLFVTTTGQLKVLDFGIARLKELSSHSNATRSGITMGTPAFMSPEQARGLWDEVDARTDLWAVGATMFTLLTGRYVHEGRTPNEQLLAAMTATAPPLATLVDGVSPAIAEVVDRALAFDTAARWPGASAMQTALRVAHGAAPARTLVIAGFAATSLPAPVPTATGQTQLAASTGSLPGRAAPVRSIGSNNVAAIAAAVATVAIVGAVASRNAAPSAARPTVAADGPVASASVVSATPTVPSAIDVTPTDAAPTASATPTIAASAAPVATPGAAPTAIGARATATRKPAVSAPAARSPSTTPATAGSLIGGGRE